MAREPHFWVHIKAKQRDITVWKGDLPPVDGRRAPLHRRAVKGGGMEYAMGCYYAALRRKGPVICNDVDDPGGCDAERNIRTEQDEHHVASHVRSLKGRSNSWKQSSKAPARGWGLGENGWGAAASNAARSPS